MFYTPCLGDRRGTRDSTRPPRTQNVFTLPTGSTQQFLFHVLGQFHFSLGLCHNSPRRYHRQRQTCYMFQNSTDVPPGRGACYGRRTGPYIPVRFVSFLLGSGVYSVVAREEAGIGVSTRGDANGFGHTTVVKLSWVATVGCARASELENAPGNGLQCYETWD